MTRRRIASLFSLPAERVDERDIMFSRAARRPGTPTYEDYYARRPELKKGDDRIRSLPALGQPGGLHYDPVLSPESDAWFERIEAIQPDSRVVETWAGRLRAGNGLDAAVRRMCLELGAVAAGCAPLDEAFIYSHKGRFDEDYGRPVQLEHPSAIVFLVEMDFGAMRHAPHAPVLRESARQYHRAAEIGMTVEAALCAAGHSAKVHYDAHYDVILPPLAVRAGLGELGRHNILIAERFGSRVRIGAVTTDAPVRHGEPVNLGVRAFCDICRKCAANCPSSALSSAAPADVRGVSKWPTEVQRCYGYWRAAGTDCGICMACCPFSHPDNAFHNLVRGLVKRFPLTHRFLHWCDNLIYGRGWSARSD